MKIAYPEWINYPARARPPGWVLTAAVVLVLFSPSIARSRDTWKTSTSGITTTGCLLASKDVDATAEQKDRVCWCVSSVLESMWSDPAEDLETMETPAAKDAFLRAVEACVYADGATRERPRDRAARTRPMAEERNEPLATGWTAADHAKASLACGRGVRVTTSSDAQGAFCSCLVSRVATKFGPKDGHEVALRGGWTALADDSVRFVSEACRFAADTRRTAPGSWSRSGYLEFRFGMGPADVLKVLRSETSQIRSSDPLKHWRAVADVYGVTYYWVPKTTLSVASAEVRAVFGFLEGRLFKIALEATSADASPAWKRRVLPLLIEKYGRPQETPMSVKWVSGGLSVELDMTGLTYADRRVCEKVRTLEAAAFKRERDAEKKSDLDKL